MSIFARSQENIESKRLETFFLEGLDSGDKIEISEEWWENKRQELTQRRSQEKP